MLVALQNTGCIMRWCTIIAHLGLIDVILGEKSRESLRYLKHMGITHLPILPKHPQTNGVIDPYNCIVVARLHRILVELLGVGWCGVLPDILEGLRILPSRLGF